MNSIKHKTPLLGRLMGIIASILEAVSMSHDGALGRMSDVKLR